MNDYTFEVSLRAVVRVRAPNEEIAGLFHPPWARLAALRFVLQTRTTLPVAILAS
jgi:hypothetical protein